MVVSPNNPYQWFCTYTTSPGEEGDSLQNIAGIVSYDKGETWSKPINIEKATSIESSWGLPLVTAFDRIYVFYVFNGDLVRKLPEGTPIRSDTHGWYCYRYSDDFGVTWSNRYRLKMPLSKKDLNNEFEGKVQMFWGIGKPVVKKNDMWFSFTKLGGYFLANGEGWIYHSNNILNELDENKIIFSLLPGNSGKGIRNQQFGSTQEEHNIQPMNQEDGLICVYRTELGQPASAYSYDNGNTWTNPELMKYANGNPLRNPRACPRIWKAENGRYLLWYHNNGGIDFGNRNPAWISGGIEENGKIKWSDPEIFLYSNDLSHYSGRISYPDLIELDDEYWVTTTQKQTGSLHKIPNGFFDNVWNQFGNTHRISKKDLIFESDDVKDSYEEIPLKIDLSKKGCTLDLWFSISPLSNSFSFSLQDKQANGLNIRIDVAGNFAIELVNRGNKYGGISGDKSLTINDKINHHMSLIFDSGPGIMLFIFDGSVFDGGGNSVFGYDWYQYPEKIEINTISISENMHIPKLRIYNKGKLVSEMISNYKSEYHLFN